MESISEIDSNPYEFSFAYKITKNCVQVCNPEQADLVLAYPRCFHKPSSTFVPPSNCDHLTEPTPEYRPRCIDNEFLSNCPAFWKSQPWSSCDCSNETRTRKVTCWKYLLNGLTSRVSDSTCTLDKPDQTQNCQCTEAQKIDFNKQSSKQGEFALLEPSWMIGAWTECQTSGCSVLGIQKREIVCSGNQCVGPQPAITRNCRRASKCGIEWVVGHWGECDCTTGIQSRSVACYDFNGEKSFEELCLQTEAKPVDKRRCNRECASWKMGPWSVCSSCDGKGIRSRSVMVKIL